MRTVDRLQPFTSTIFAEISALATATGAERTITPGSSDFYAALIHAFAAGVDQTINGSAPR